ncbi:hypothetical protein HMPREF9554_01493 [Treponema phagedenis F0421]|nr:hypothetical protein HMPREF9554_01493 [Treponema phagedenis F0421]
MTVAIIINPRLHKKYKNRCVNKTHESIYMLARNCLFMNLFFRI